MRTDDILKRFGFSGIAQPPATRAATDELAERNIRQIEENPNESAEAKAQAIATVRQAQANAHRRLDQIEATFLGIQYSGIWKGVQDLNPFSFDGWNLSILDGAGLTVGIDGLVVGSKNGVSVTSDGLSIGSSDGLRITSNGIFIAGSDGFHITHQGVFIAGNSGLTIAQNRVSVGGYQLFSADVYGIEIDLDVPWDFSQMEPPRLAAERTAVNLTERGTLTNLFPEDAALLQGRARTLVQDDAGRYWLQSGSKRITPSGSYDFVTMPDGTIRVARTNPSSEFSTHLGLSGGDEVSYAGTIRFANRNTATRGTIRSWSNDSGHYQPPAWLSGNSNLPPNLFVPR